METSNTILGILNSDIYSLRSTMNKYHETEIVNDNNFECKQDVHYIFTSFTSLQKNLEIINRTPILSESPSVIRLINISHPIVVLDGKYLDNGLILFQPIDFKILKKNLGLNFIFRGEIVFNKSENTSYGNISELSISLNSFLNTLPSISHEPFMVSLATSLETKNLKSLKQFTDINRLVTNENEEKFNDLLSIIRSNRNIISMLISKDKKLSQIKDIKDKLNMRRFRFILNYFGSKRLEAYLDKENTINIKGLRGCDNECKPE